MTPNLLVLIGTLAAIALCGVYTVITGISPVPTSPAVQSLILSLVPGELELAGEVFELGSGWGNLAMALGDTYSDRVVEAFELSPIPLLFALAWRLLRRHRNVNLHWGDILKADLKRASLVVCYLHPAAMSRLAPKFAAELRPGALVVCNFFGVPGWEPVATMRARDQDASPVYVYRAGHSPARSRAAPPPPLQETPGCGPSGLWFP